MSPKREVSIKYNTKIFYIFLAVNNNTITPIDIQDIISIPAIICNNSRFTSTNLHIIISQPGTNIVKIILKYSCIRNIFDNPKNLNIISIHKDRRIFYSILNTGNKNIKQNRTQNRSLGDPSS